MSLNIKTASGLERIHNVRVKPLFRYSDAVVHGWITPKEYEEITGEPYEKV